MMIEGGARIERACKRGGAGRAFVLGLLLCASLVFSGLASASPPEVLPTPPADGGEEGADDDDGLPGVIGEDGALTPEEALELELIAQREEEFQDHLARAKRAEREQRWQEAEREFQAALRIKDNDPEVLQGLGHARRRNTPAGQCPRRAIENLLLLEVYDPKGLWITERAWAVVWMGDCDEAYADERLTLSLELAQLAPDAPGRPIEVRVIAANELWNRAERSSEPDGAGLRQRAREQLTLYFEEAKTRGEEASADALFLRGTIYREAEELTPAIEAYKRFVELYPRDDRRKRADVWIEDLDIQRTVQQLEEAQGGLPTEKAEAAFKEGIEAMRRGDLSVAQSHLEFAVADSPWFPQAHYHLGQLHARRGRFPAAIEALQKAAAMEPMDYAAHMALGLVYYKEYKGAEDERARNHLSLALRLRPDLYQLHYYLGDLLRHEGAAGREAAREHFEGFIAACPPDDPLLGDAKEALQGLKREAVDTAQIDVMAPPSSELRRLDPKLQRLINEAYVVGAEHGDWNRAEKLLLRALKDYPREPALLNELAKVNSAKDRPGTAREYWDQSLEIDNDQQEVHERLGLMLDLSEEGMYHLRRAAELGSNTARFALARRLWQRYELWEASEQLDLYLMAAGPYDLGWEQANTLRAQWDVVFLRIYVGAAILFLLILSIPTWRIYRRLRGSSLAQLLDRAPKSFPEVARILSLIRHEILKHNTAFLSDVGHALEMDAPDADVRSTLLARRLFGSHDAISEFGPHRSGQFERRGIYGRFLGYCEELEAVARSHGVTLNLARKDPTFSTMLRAFEDVARRAEWLRHPGKLRSTRRLELARTLGYAGDVLGRKAFERLSGIIHELCIVEVDAPLLIEVFTRVGQEDQFRGMEIAPLAVEGQGARIRIFQTDLEDILVNVFRNSLHSAAVYAPQPLRLGVGLELEVDEITGLETLAIRVKDQSTERLTNEMLRGRYVERGMGITADLLSRYDGSIAVESEPAWEKAVVLRFFAVEEHTSGE